MLLPGAHLDEAHDTLEHPPRQGPQLHLHSCTTAQSAQSTVAQLTKLSDCLLTDFICYIILVATYSGCLAAPDGLEGMHVICRHCWTLHFIIIRICFELCM